MLKIEWSHLWGSPDETVLYASYINSSPNPSVVLHLLYKERGDLIKVRKKSFHRWDKRYRLKKYLVQSCTEWTFYRKYRGFEGPSVDSDCVVDEKIIRERLLYLQYAFRTIRS
jgi:hypothetical protein